MQIAALLPKAFFLFALFLSGCSVFMPNPCCPPPPSARPPLHTGYSLTQPTIAPAVPSCSEELGLADVVDVALQNSPKTRSAWYAAKQAATDVGVARGAFLPSVDLQGFWLTEQLPTTGLTDVFIFREKILGFMLSTTYLLYDFGGRNGNLGAAISALDSLCWSYNWQIQTVMIHAIQSYYNFIFAREIVFADEATVEDNLTTVEAAVARRSAGITSLSDELQAKTALIQSQIILEQDRGNLNIANATLIQSLGLPPDTPLCVMRLPDWIEAEGVCGDMAHILQAAKEHRSDLWAQRSTIQQKRFQIQVANSALMPNVNTQVQGGKESINGSRYADAYLLQFNLNIPLFHSFADINALRKAQAALLEAQADLDDQELSAFLSVLSDYYELLANQQILKYSYNYISVAQENREVAYANYTAGVTTIIDLMIANNALNTARKQLIAAKINFLTSLANLAYDTGSLTERDLSCDYPPWMGRKTECVHD